MGNLPLALAKEDAAGFEGVGAGCVGAGFEGAPGGFFCGFAFALFFGSLAGFFLDYAVELPVESLGFCLLLCEFFFELLPLSFQLDNKSVGIRLHSMQLRFVFAQRCQPCRKAGACRIKLFFLYFEEARGFEQFVGFFFLPLVQLLEIAHALAGLGECARGEEVGCRRGNLSLAAYGAQ